MRAVDERVNNLALTESETPEVSVVITNYNGAAALGPTITSLMVQENVRLLEIIMADNQSTDESVRVVTETFPTVKILSTGSNNGPNLARNLGLRHASAPLVLIMDNDLVLAPDYIFRLARLMHLHPNAGASQRENSFLQQTGYCSIQRNRYSLCRRSPIEQSRLRGMQHLQLCFSRGHDGEKVHRRKGRLV
jgi:glycosyltransferase involved in cell wall biosynthesis